MFLIKALQAVNTKCPLVPAENIAWDLDDAFDENIDHQYHSTDFHWYRDDFSLAHIGSAGFQWHLLQWIKRFLRQKNDDPVTVYDELLANLVQGKEIDNPVEIALVFQPNFENERLFVVDGWHRIALYLTAGRTHIPSIIGVPLNSPQCGDINSHQFEKLMAARDYLRGVTAYQCHGSEWLASGEIGELSPGLIEQARDIVRAFERGESIDNLPLNY